MEGSKGLGAVFCGVIMCKSRAPYFAFDIANEIHIMKKEVSGHRT